MDFKRSKKSSKRIRKAPVSPESEINDTVDSEENVTGRFVCDQCKKVLFSTKAVSIHKAKHHKKHKTSFDGLIIKHCEFCKHKITLSATTENKEVDIYVCSRCKDSLYQPADESLREPTVKKEIEKYNVECFNCGRYFDSHCGMTMHMKMHEYEKDIIKYVCNLCDYKCPILSNFLKHYQKHDKVPSKGKDLKCEYCNKTFSKVDKYIKHVKTHSEYNESRKEIMFKCSQPLCTAVFLKKDSFVNHQYKHQYIQYECGVCYKLFKSSRSHTRHSKKCGSGSVTEESSVYNSD